MANVMSELPAASLGGALTRVLTWARFTAPTADTLPATGWQYPTGRG